MAQAQKKEKVCIHCGTLVPFSWRETDFCCSGCQYVYRLIHEYNLDRYYELKPDQNQPLVGLFQRKESFDWVDQDESVKGGKIRLEIEGVQCAACIWLVKELASQFGTARVHVNSALGTLTIDFVPTEFELKEYLLLIQEFGYKTSKFNPKKTAKKNSSLLIRFGLSTALSINAMMISASFYVGLDRSLDPTLFGLFSNINFVLATLVVLIGGSYFLERAILALRNRVLHFDLPIAVGLVLAYVGSVVAHFSGYDDNVYFDTVCIFISLMLLGRFLQNRMIEKNKSQILADDKLHHLKAKKINDGLEEIPFSEVKKGDHLLLSKGEIVPTDAKMISRKKSQFSLRWINGESKPTIYQNSDTIPSGAQLLSDSIEVETLSDFSFSTLFLLLPDAQMEERMPKYWSAVTRYYVIAVLSLVSLSFLFWSFIDVEKAFQIAIALSVVTCPCGLGIAVPLARSLANKKIMSLGVFVRDPYFLEMLSGIRNVFFDKTGTLTLSNLHLVNQDEVLSLSEVDLQVLFSATARSHHPASQAIYQVLLGQKITFVNASVAEVVGSGLEIRYQEQSYFLGKSKQEQNENQYQISFQKNGHEILQIILEETILDHAKETIRNFKEQGIEAFQISGDKKVRVQDVALQLGIDPKNSFGECSPTEKADLIEKYDRNDSLYLGDGLNDSLAFQKAFVSGSPLTEHASLIEQSHFFFVSSSLEFLRKLFVASRKLRSTIGFNIRFAIFYNFTVVIWATMGWITPLFCAILMPLSSLFVVGTTSFRLKNMI